MGLPLTTLFFSLLLLYAAGDDHESSSATIIMNNETAVRNSCISVALQDFYAFSDNAELIQRDNRSCHSQNQNGNVSSANGVLWLGASANISRKTLAAKKLMIGVPIKHGFFEFMKVDDSSKPPIVSGFPVTVFKEVMDTLPYDVTYDFDPFHDHGAEDHPEYYDKLISQVYYQKFDAVVGDMSITPNRSDFVDFTYEYMEGGVSMIVPIKDDDTMSAFWFFKPLKTDLWLTTLAFALMKGIIVWVFEHQQNSDFQGKTTSELIGKILTFSLSTFVFAYSSRLKSNYSKFVENLWTFLVYILVTAYAANLTSMLTVEKLEPTVTDVKSLLKNRENVGYQNGSFVYGFLKKLGFDDSNLKRYSTIEQYADALERGSGNGGVSAIMDEIPYIKVFLRSHCGKYTMAGPTYRTGGLCFVFPRGSPMVPDISRAVLNFIQGERMKEIESQWFGDQTTCPDQAQVTSIRLPLYSLRSIFIITGGAAALAFFIYFIQLFYRRMRDEAVRETVQENGMWMKFLAMSNYFRRMGTSLGNSRFAPGVETSEFSFGNDHQQDHCSVEVGLTENHIDHGKNDVNATPPQDLSMDMAHKKITRARSRVRRNYSNLY